VLGAENPARNFGIVVPICRAFCGVLTGVSIVTALPLNRQDKKSELTTKTVAFQQASAILNTTLRKKAMLTAVPRFWRRCIRLFVV